MHIPTGVLRRLAVEEVAEDFVRGLSHDTFEAFLLLADLHANERELLYRAARSVPPHERHISRFQLTGMDDDDCNMILGIACHAVNQATLECIAQGMEHDYQLERDVIPFLPRTESGERTARTLRRFAS